MYPRNLYCKECWMGACIQCRKAYHSFCIDVIKTSQSAPCWHGKEIQPDYNLIAWRQTQTTAASVDSIDASVAEETGPQLPVEIWAIVFRKLSFNDWCTARMVNSRWKNIIHGDRLIMSKLIFKFPRVKYLGSVFLPLPALPAATINFKNTQIRYVGSWWSPQITENLVNLEFLENTFIQLKIILTMLRHTPNLVALSAWSSSSSMVSTRSIDEFPDFQLSKMEKLTLKLGGSEQSSVLKVFNRMCPRLKEFSLLSYYDVCCDGVLGMISTVPSLEGISLVSSSKCLYRLGEVKHQFKRVSITIPDSPPGENFNENLISFSEKQPLLECFNLDVGNFVPSIDNHVLTTVLQNFHRLKRLSMKLSPTLSSPIVQREANSIDLQAVGRLTELEHLTIRAPRYYYLPLLIRARIPKLRELFLVNVVTSLSALQYIANAPSLHTIALTLEGRALNSSWSEFFTTIPLKTIRRLELTNISMRRPNQVNLGECFDELQYLKLRNCKLTEQCLSKLFGLCPRLEELHLTEMENVSDAIVLVLCQKMQQLRNLTIIECAITDASARHITEHGLNLEQLTIENCEKLTTEGATQLRQARIAKVDIKFKPADVDVQDNL